MSVDARSWLVGIVGPGRAARAFARSWVAAGGRIGPVLAREGARAWHAAAEVGGRPESFASGRIDCDLLVLGVSDDAISSVAREISPRTACRFAFHLSGALPAEEISPLRQQATSIGSLHPVRAFSGEPSETWRAAFVAIEGDDAAANAGQEVVRVLDARGRRISTQAKALYHAAATLAAGGSVALISMAARLWASVGIPEDEGRPALADLASHATGAANPLAFERSFTGPVARRDVGTIRAHRAALAAWPEILAVYVALARETLQRTPGRGKEQEILAILEGGGPPP